MVRFEYTGTAKPKDGRPYRILVPLATGKRQAIEFAPGASFEVPDDATALDAVRKARDPKTKQPCYREVS